MKNYIVPITVIASIAIITAGAVIAYTNYNKTKYKPGNIAQDKIINLMGSGYDFIQ